MKMMVDDKIREYLLWYALLNATKYDGKASFKAVMSRALGEHKEWRSIAKDIATTLRDIIAKVNSMSLEEQRELLQTRFSGWVEKKVERKKRELFELPELPSVDERKGVVMRFAPNPDFVITLGNARPAILNDEYVKKYGGKYILRFDDTDPKVKTPFKDAYEIIKEDLKWLGIKWHEVVIQSKRLELFYNMAEELIKRGGAYVCTCTKEEFKKYKSEGRGCPHRSHEISKNLELWDKMLEGRFGEEEAVLRVKTDPAYPDPSIREWVAFRIIDTSKSPHPVVGDKYIVWPTYNFASAVDDYLLEVTHILRAKEHIQNTTKQKFIYKYMGWNYPITIHFGRLMFSGFTLSKSKIRKAIESNPEKYWGYDDPRFGTIAALRRRGFTPEAIRRLIISSGLREVNVKISFENFASLNKKIIDDHTVRLMFVKDPVRVIVKGADVKETVVPNHPSNKELGSHKISLRNEDGTVELFLSKEDIEIFRRLKIVRLMHLFNIVYEGESNGTILARFHSSSVSDLRNIKETKIIQWVSADSEPLSIYIPQGEELIAIEGLCEPYIRNFAGKVVQFIRFGFVKIEKRDGKIIGIFTHQ